MEWEDDAGVEEGEEGAHGVDKAFTLIGEGPPAPTLRGLASSTKEGATEAERLTGELQLRAFGELYPGEPKTARLARAAAAERCWGHLAASIKGTLESTDAAVFEDLLSFARQQHAGPHSQGASAGSGQGAVWSQVGNGYQRVPTGLVLAGGVNSADHTRTFPNLLAFLRQHGCYVALLQPHTFGKMPGEALNEVLRQVSGLDTKAEHLDALAAWYQDETGGGPAADALGAAAEGAAAGGLQEDVEEEEAGGPHAAAETAAAADGCGEGEARQLRQRPTPMAAGRRGRHNKQAQQENAQRPLVVVVEATEGVDAACLHDFILTLSEARGELPVTLVLGLTTTAGALQQLVPSEVTDRCMECTHFRLATAMSRLDTVVREVLLGGCGAWPGLLFSQRLVEELHTLFLNHHYSTGIILQGLKHAALRHFETQPASYLAAAAADSPAALAEALGDAPAPLLAQLRKQMECRRPSELEGCISDAMDGWSRWAVAVHWLALAAQAVGLSGQDFQYWKLYEQALGPRFAADPAPFARLEPLLRKLSAEAVAALAQRLAQRGEAVWHGAQAAEDLLEKLQEFVCAGEGQQQAGGAEAVVAAEGAQPAQQHQQQQEEEDCAAADHAVREQAEGEQQQGTGAGGKPKHDRYHSKESRKEALLAKSAHATAAKGSASAAAAAQRAQQEQTPGARFARWLVPALKAALAAVPTRLPGAAPFTCRDLAVLDCLTAEPRMSLHAALTQPHIFLPGLQEELGLNPKTEDACLAYQLLDQDPNCVNVADWFKSFLDVHLQEPRHKRNDGASSSGSGDASAARTTRKAAVKQGKGGAAGKGSKGGQAAASQEAEEARKRKLKELAARFTQATSELQYVGLIKPAKRRRGDYVQRLVHMPAAD